MGTCAGARWQMCGQRGVEVVGPEADMPELAVCCR